MLLLLLTLTGPFADKLLEMDKDPQGLPPKIDQPPRMVVPSSGVHVVLPEYYCPRDMGLLDPSTSDGRVMFFLNGKERFWLVLLILL